jgi:hypothetical protein
MMISWWTKHAGVILRVLMCDIWINVVLKTSELVGSFHIIFDLTSEKSKFQHDITYAPNVAISIHHLPKKNPAGTQECKDFKNKGSWIFLDTPADVLSNNTAISSSSSHRCTTSCNTLLDTRNCHFTGHINCSMSVACTQTSTLLSDDLHVSVVTTQHHQAVPTDKTLEFLCVLH